MSSVVVADPLGCQVGHHSRRQLRTGVVTANLVRSAHLLPPPLSPVQHCGLRKRFGVRFALCLGCKHFWLHFHTVTGESQTLLYIPAFW